MGGETGSKTGGGQTGEPGSLVRAQTGQAHLVSCKMPIFSAALLSSGHWLGGVCVCGGGMWASEANLTKQVSNCN